MTDKTRIYNLTKEQVSSLILNEGGTYTIPDNFEVYIVPSAEDLRKQRITELEAELAQMGEPTTEELILEGKMTHPYYMLISEYENLKLL